MISFRNHNKRDSSGQPCDGRWGIHISNCDHRLTFCFDGVNGDQGNTEECAFYRAETGEFRENSELSFDHDMQGVANPIVLHFHEWPGGVLFKVLVTDDDSPTSGADRVDTYAEKFQNDPARSKAQARTDLKVYTGMRTRTTPTSLTVEWKVYCDKDYYGSKCSVHCVPEDSDAGHYTCHPDTGEIVCRPGWESPPDYCTIKADDCDPDPCRNGATCSDGNRNYTCDCKAGYTGQHCETDIDECESSPCENNGTCTDMVAKYSCECPREYAGTNCQHHICDVASPCLNGGSCYDDGKCLCLPEYTGRYCQSAICNGVTCENNGTCTAGVCHCVVGFVGQRCDVNVCDYHECHNNGTCLPEKRCACISGWTGIHCEFPISDCDNVTCFNGGVCYEFNGATLCHCPLHYEGKFCQMFNPPEVTALPTTTKKDKEIGIINGVGKVIYTEPKNNKGMIIGLIVAGFAILLIAIIVLAMRRHRRKKQAEQESQTGGMESFTNPVYSAQNDSVAFSVGTDAGTQDTVNVADQATQAGGAAGGPIKPDYMYSKDMPVAGYGPYPSEDPPAYYAELPPLPGYSPHGEGAMGGEGLYDVPRGMTSYDVPKHLRSNPPDGATGGFDEEPIYEMPGPSKSLPDAEVSRPELDPKNYVLPDLPEKKE